jgi:hypothetical protein
MGVVICRLNASFAASRPVVVKFNKDRDNDVFLADKVKLSLNEYDQILEAFG